MAASNLFLRVASAVVLLPLVIGLVLWKNPTGFALFILVVTALGLNEWTRMTLKGRSISERFVVVAAGTGFSAISYAAPQLALPALLFAVLVVASNQLYFAKPIETAGLRLGVSLAGIVYVAGLLVALPLIKRDLSLGGHWVLLAMGVTFSCDTGAYFVGRALGKRKLAPAVSPGKSWEGFGGGFAAAIAFAFVARATFFEELTAVDSLVVGCGGAVLGPVGDLVESMLKRSSGVKDSGNIIPGHGGILDRVDALLFVAAFVFVYASFTG